MLHISISHSRPSMVQMVNQPSHTNLVHVGTGFGRGLHVADFPLIGSGFGLLHSDLSPVFQIRLISNQQEGNILILLNPEDLLSEKQKIPCSSTLQPSSHKIPMSQQFCSFPASNTSALCCCRLTGSPMLVAEKKWSLYSYFRDLVFSLANKEV